MTQTGGEESGEKMKRKALTFSFLEFPTPFTFSCLLSFTVFPAFCVFFCCLSSFFLLFTTHFLFQLIFSCYFFFFLLFCSGGWGYNNATGPNRLSELWSYDVAVMRKKTKMNRRRKIQKGSCRCVNDQKLKGRKNSKRRINKTEKKLLCLKQSPLHRFSLFLFAWKFFSFCFLLLFSSFLRLYFSQSTQTNRWAWWTGGASLAGVYNSSSVSSINSMGSRSGASVSAFYPQSSTVYINGGLGRNSVTGGEEREKEKRREEKRKRKRESEILSSRLDLNLKLQFLRSVNNPINGEWEEMKYEVGKARKSLQYNSFLVVFLSS